MAGKSGNGSGSTRTKGAKSSSLPSIEFINVQFTEADKVAYKHWISEERDLFSLMDDCVMAGYKLSTGYDERGGSPHATITNRNGSPEFINHCITIRGRSVGEAIARVLWLHFIRCEGDWNEVSRPSDTADIW